MIAAALTGIVIAVRRARRGKPVSGARIIRFIAFLVLLALVIVPLRYRAESEINLHWDQQTVFVAYQLSYDTTRTPQVRLSRARNIVQQGLDDCLDNPGDFSLIRVVRATWFNSVVRHIAGESSRLSGFDEGRPCHAWDG